MGLEYQIYPALRTDFAMAVHALIGTPSLHRQLRPRNDCFEG